MTHTSSRPDHATPAALAAALRLWVVELVVWLVEMLGEGPLGAALKRWTLRELADAERAAAGLAVLSAMALLPEPVTLGPRQSRRPMAAPRGFARVLVRGNDMRRMTRHLFPRERNLLTRARRLGAFLDALVTRARRLARRIDRVRPASRITMVAPPRAPCVSRAAAPAPASRDTS